MKKFLLCVISFVLTISFFGSYNAISMAQPSTKNEFGEFSSTSYLLMDANSDAVLYSFNANQKLPVASICKLMTTLLTLESIENGTLNIDDEVIASEHACDAEGSQVFLDAGSKYKVSELIKSVVIASANDSAIVLAETIGGTENYFTKLMNDKAKHLGMNNTLYANATGLPAPSQYSTAFDTAIILKELQKYPMYSDFCKIWTDKFTHPSGRVTDMVNTNRLIRYYDYCTSGKTGFTDEAGYCLSSVATKDNMTLVAVVLNCKDSAARFKESMQLYNYGFANFVNKQVVSSATTDGITIKVKNGTIDNVNVVPQSNYSIIDKRGNEGNVEITFEIVDNIKAPFDKGTFVGYIVVTKNGEVVTKIPLLTSESVAKHSYKNVIDKVLRDWQL